MSKQLRKDDLIRVTNNPTQGWKIRSVVPDDGLLEMRNLATNTIEFLSLRDIYANLQSRSWTYERIGAPKLPLTENKSPKSEKALEHAMDCLSLVNKQMCGGKRSFNEAYEVAKAGYERAFPTCKFKSKATLYRYKDAALQGMPLLAGDHNKGGHAYYDDTVDEVIERVCRTNLLKRKSRWQIHHATQLIRLELKGKLSEEKRKKLTCKYVRRVLKRISPNPSMHRIDAKDVPAQHAVATQRILVNRALERVEGDAFYLPIKLDLENGSSIQPNLLLQADCHTGMALSHNLIVGNSREVDMYECIRRGLMSKKPMFEELGINCDQDIFGRYAKGIFDNGSENQGRIPHLSKLQIDIHYCKSRNPVEKPHIERLGRSLKDALCMLPGSTRFEGKDGERDPEAEGDVLMTFKEFERWLVKWLYEEYANRPLKRHLLINTTNFDFDPGSNPGYTPMQRWEFEMQNCVMAEPVTEQEWQRAYHVRKLRKLTRTGGIHIDGMNYKGPALDGLIRKFGESTAVEVLIDPMDYRYVWVNAGLEDGLIRLTEQYVTVESLAYTVAEYKLKIEEAKARQEEALANDPRTKIAEAAQHERLLAGEMVKPVRTKRKKSTQGDAAEQRARVVRAHRERDAAERALRNPHVPDAEQVDIDTQTSAMSFDDLPHFEGVQRHRQKVGS